MYQTRRIKEAAGGWRWCCPELCQGGLTLWLCWSGLCRENIMSPCVQGQADLSGSTCSLWGPAALQASLEHSVKKAIFQVDYYHNCFHFGLLFLLYCLLYCLYILERIQIERSSLKMSRVVKWTTPEEKKIIFVTGFICCLGLESAEGLPCLTIWFFVLHHLNQWKFLYFT